MAFSCLCLCQNVHYDLKRGTLEPTLYGVHIPELLLYVKDLSEVYKFSNRLPLTQIDGSFNVFFNARSLT